MSFSGRALAVQVSGTHTAPYAHRHTCKHTDMTHTDTQIHTLTKSSNSCLFIPMDSRQRTVAHRLMGHPSLFSAIILTTCLGHLGVGIWCLKKTLPNDQSPRKQQFQGSRKFYNFLSKLPWTGKVRSLKTFSVSFPFMQNLSAKQLAKNIEVHVIQTSDSLLPYVSAEQDMGTLL